MGIRAAKSRVVVGVDVVYENGAKVLTSFVSSCGPTIRSSPLLYELIDKAVKEYAKELKGAELPIYKYPPEVMTATRLNFLSKYGQEFACDDCVRISELDSQKEQGKGIYGSGFLISTKSAEQAARAEQAIRQARETSVIAWELSEREKAIIKQLDEKAVKIHCAEEAK